jgi:hypothetical protein
MKRLCLLLAGLCSLCSLPLQRVSAETLSFSLGADYGIGTFDVDRDSGAVNGGTMFRYHEKSGTLLYAPGFSVIVRHLAEYTDKTSVGLVFRGGAVFATDMKQTGTVAMKSAFSTFSYSESFSETLSASDDDFFMSTMNFGLGTSRRTALSEKSFFCMDLGLSVSISDFEQQEGLKLNYVGVGLFSGLAFQLTLTGAVYVEIGLNAVIVFMSHQEGSYDEPYSYDKLHIMEFEDSGMLDVTWLMPYIHIGWNMQLNKKSE